MPDPVASEAVQPRNPPGRAPGGRSGAVALAPGLDVTMATRAALEGFQRLLGDEKRRRWAVGVEAETRAFCLAEDGSRNNASVRFPVSEA